MFTTNIVTNRSAEDLSRRSMLRSLRTRLSLIAVLSLAIAYGSGLWLQLLHAAEGSHDLGGLAPAALWLRDSSLALPFIALLTWLALRLADRLLRVRPGVSGGQEEQAAPTPLLRRATQAALVALLTSAGQAALSPLHGWLFATHRDATALFVCQILGLPSADTLALHMLDDGLFALAVNLPIAGLVAALMLVRPSAALRRLRRARVRSLLPGLASLTMLAAPLSGSLASVVHAATNPAPCPPEAPLKIFDVSAIDVNMWLDRFGDHDPNAQMYVLNGMIGAVRNQEVQGPQSLSIGLRDDPIQPLAIRANEGDCVLITFTNATTRPAPQGGTPGKTTNNYGLHIDGLAFQMSSSGDAIGNNPSSSVPQGSSAQYVYYIPNDPTLEGAHYISPGPGNRQAVAHGLFGSLNVEPPGSTYLNMTTGLPQLSGWEAIIVPGTGKSFREGVKIFHEIGNESEGGVPVDINGNNLPLIDPHTGAYRPGARAINYRSEPFMDRLNFAEDQKSVVYSSYTFADTTNIIPRGYVGDPTKFRLVHGGSEIFHVYHLHGGADRWRFNPKADPTYDYAKTGLDKHPVEVQSESARLDSQSMGPGESFDLEIENGAGGAQQGAGEFLFHCHIAHHYFAGMWGYWRVFDTLQPDLMPLPDRASLPQAVDSSALVGKTINGQTITAENLDAWIRPQLPTQGVTHDINVATRDTADQDASVWDWAVDQASGLYLGEPDRTVVMPDSATKALRGRLWVDYTNTVPGHPAALPIDQAGVQSTYLLNGSPVTFNSGGYLANGNRPKLLFNPANGRPAWPLLRTHIGKRPPFSPNGHSGAPYLGEYGGQAPSPTLPVGTTSTATIDPWANRPDGICPAGAPLRKYNVVGIAVPITVTDPAKGSKVVDPNGALDVLAQDKNAIYAGTKVYAGVTSREPLALRANIGDCVGVTYVSELKDGSPELPYSKTNIHIHHVQFDTQASDGVISGFSFEQSIRPYKIVDPQLTSSARAGDTVLKLASVAKFQPGVWIAVGMGLESIEVRQIVSIDAARSQVALSQRLGNAHASGEWAGTEFVQYRWYPDVELDNIFFHDHVNGIHGWSHGMVGQLVIEPQGSRYFDPVTGTEIRAGAIADIHTDPTCQPANSGVGNQCALIPGVIDGSYREFVLWTINDHEPDSAEATLNLRAEPWRDRSSNPALRFSSNTPAGDPFTPLPKAYVGDPFVIRNINVGQGTNTLSIDGHRTFWEPRYRNALGVESSPIDTIHTTVSEKYTLILDGGAGGPNHVPGDYLYHDGESRRFQSGAWGIIRVLPSLTPTLKPLPGRSIPAQTPVCPAGARPHSFAVSAINLPGSIGGAGVGAAFVPTAQAAAVLAGQLAPEPLVLHVAAGECVTITLTNQRQGTNASIHIGGLLHDQSSAGINVGKNTGEQTVAPGASKTYTYYADSQKLESVMVADFGGDNSGLVGLYGALVVAPAGATFRDPTTGKATDSGSQVEVSVPGKAGYRDFTTILADQDPIIGQAAMPYPANVSGPALLNYRSAGQRTDDASMFSSLTYGDPATPLLRAYAGDPVKVHVLGAPASEQMHVFSLGGMSWPGDMYIDGSSQWQSRAVGPWEKIDLSVSGGAGGALQQPGDYFYGDLRRPFTEAGMWGLFRVLPNTCSGGGIAGLLCLGQAASIAPALGLAGVSPVSGSTAGGTQVTISGSGFDTAPGGTTISFGGAAATSVSCASDSRCTATTPAHADGTVVVAVTARGSTVTLRAGFTYVAPAVAPTVTGVSPSSGDTGGGTVVTVTGNGFNTVGGTTITFGGLAATGVSCSSSTRCTAITPPGSLGAVNVGASVSNLSGSLPGAFSYIVAEPVVSIITSNSGATAGGTVIAITGDHFSTAAKGTGVTFGGVAATNVSCISTSNCVATSPAHAAGPVDVVVTVGGLSSEVSELDRFIYYNAAPRSVTYGLPALSQGYGYYYVVTTQGPGVISVSWQPPVAIAGAVAVYAGTPFAGKTDPANTPPPAGALAMKAGVLQSFNVTTPTRPAGTYTIYFFALTPVRATTATVTALQ